jgi:hypothetical protein
MEANSIPGSPEDEDEAEAFAKKAADPVSC